VSKKHEKVAAMIGEFHGRGLDPHYLGYFDYFNRGLFYESHDVLEQLWLADRTGPDYAFYKGLIQLAGAFVHLQKNRLRPAAALFKLARTNLEKYPSPHQQLDLIHLLQIIEEWLQRLEVGDWIENPLTSQNAPQLALLTNP
jgi:predicted metal-dependent hydrolase